MGIWVTGDIHGNPKRFSQKNFPQQEEMTKDDVMIICGDFGMIWDWKGESKSEKYELDLLNDRSFTTVFVDGNHENFDRLYSYPVKEWNGGKVHEIRPSVLHLMRGEIFNIEGKNFFTFGGASSHDIRDGVLDSEADKEKIKQWDRDYTKLFRINKRSWWKQELPTEEEMQNGWNNLAKCNYEVDYIISHSLHASGICLLGKGLYDQDIVTKYLEEIRCKVNYDRWYAGHMHVNQAINTKDTLLYQDIIRIV